MTFGSTVPPVERLATAAASLTLGGALAWSAALLALAPAGALALGVSGAVAGWWLLGRVDPVPSPPIAQFDLEAIAAPAGLGELLLTEVAGEADELLLTDVLAAPDPDGRVVQLFADAALPRPGQMAARIDEFLGSPEARRPEAGDADARAALNAALADIRASLRA